MYKAVDKISKSNTFHAWIKQHLHHFNFQNLQIALHANKFYDVPSAVQSEIAVQSLSRIKNELISDYSS